MASIKISELNELEEASKQDLLVIVDVANNETKKIQAKNFAGGTTIPVSDTPPEDPEDGALWVDTDDEGVIVEVDQEVNSGSTNAVSNSAITNYVNGLNTYSTTETIVGYDDSQKAIYRKVFKGQLASMAIIAENVENYYGCYGCVEMASNTYPSLPYYEYSTSGAYLSTIQYISSNNTIRFVTQKAGANVTVNVNFYIEYTKTTDTATQTVS